MKILVHICCAPDAVYFLKRLRQDYPNADIVGFFYDPNIHPYEEYKLRLVETKRTCKELGIELYEGEYDLENWLSAVKGYEEEPERGARCSICFDQRLLRSAKFAKEIGASHMTTTLLMSPKKDINQIRASGEAVCKPLNIEFLALDYRKGGGTQEMFRLSKELELYHQDYCGCIYGLFKQKKEHAMEDLVSFGGRHPGSKEELTFIKEVRLYAEHELRLECKEWEFSFLNWKLLQGKLEVGGQTIPSFVRPFSASIKGLLKADPVELVGNTIYYNKGGLRVVLLEELKDEPLEQFCGLCEPTFLVSKEYKEHLLGNRASASLQTQISPDRTSLLVIGSLSASEFIGLPADTLQDARGLSFQELVKFIDERLEDIRKGRTSLVLLGASSLGNPGKTYFEQRTGKRINFIPLYSHTPLRQAKACPSPQGSYL